MKWYYLACHDEMKVPIDAPYCGTVVAGTTCFHGAKQTQWTAGLEICLNPRTDASLTP